jgi:hypothetical protein
MDPQMYIELASNLEVAAFEEWVGREYARSIASPHYPVWPDTWDGEPPPWAAENYPPPETFTYFYTRCVLKGAPMVDAGGIYVLYDDVVTFATQAQTLSNGQSYSYDIAANMKTFEQLSPLGQTAVTPPANP